MKVPLLTLVFICLLVPTGSGNNISPFQETGTDSFVDHNVKPVPLSTQEKCELMTAEQENLEELRNITGGDDGEAVGWVLALVALAIGVAVFTSTLAEL